ncbi:hypothetical protein [Deinococcus aerophilus]|uniref:Bacterial transcriptional activator domain-containing protein n=1 Tax=Deinococcus aerophilus TaxID=522488 RepID=A0ABQ2GVI6_9DEIO|nr:hypothetical protein [Deinococcus aerophilus]GGM13698.1 hypothetical protein GCM10010841_22930 [Deinococcus aerophilus]
MLRENGVSASPDAIDYPCRALTGPPITVKVFGKLQVTVAAEPVKISGRAATLLTYLALEGGPLHRTTAAQLLWPRAGAQGLRNLRVELTALRRQGIELSPNRSSSLSLQAVTELDDLQQRKVKDQTHLVAALTHPLQNFNDLGNPVLASWVRHQRQRLTQTVKQLSGSRVLPQAPLPLVLPSDQPLTQWLAERVLPEFQSFIRGTRHPQLAVYVGRPGSGRRESLEIVLARLGLTPVEITASAGLDSLRALLLVNLRAALKVGVPQEVRPLPLEQEPQTSDLAELVPLLMQAGPLAVVVRSAEHLSKEAGQLIDLLLGLARSLLVVAVTTPAGQTRLEQVLGHHDQPGWFHIIHVPALTPESLPAQDIGASSISGELDAEARFEIIRQTEGFLGAVRCQPPISAPVRGRLGQRLQRILRAEIAAALGPDLAYVQTLALLPGPFSEATALGTLGQVGLETSRAAQLLKDTLQTGILERVDSVLTVRLPEVQVRLPDAARLLCFRSELQRAALAGSLDAGDRHRLKYPSCTVPTVVQASGANCTLTPSAILPNILQPHETVQLPGGYVLLARACGWTLLRLGAADHAVPRLELHFAVPATAQHWQLRLYLQDLPHHEEPSIHILNGAGSLSRQASTIPWPQALTPGGWALAEGTLQGRHLVLSVQATNLILHLERPEFA